ELFQSDLVLLDHSPLSPRLLCPRHSRGSMQGFGTGDACSRQERPLDATHVPGHLLLLSKGCAQSRARRKSPAFWGDSLTTAVLTSLSQSILGLLLQICFRQRPYKP